MNEPSPIRKAGTCVYIVAVTGTFLLVAGLVWLMRYYTQTATPREVRSAERMAILKSFQQDNAPLVQNYDWQDQTRGIVRIPIERAEELVLQEWQNPAAAHSNLVARAAKAFAPLPKPPEKKNEYE